MKLGSESMLLAVAFRKLQIGALSDRNICVNYHPLVTTEGEKVGGGEGRDGEGMARREGERLRYIRRERGGATEGEFDSGWGGGAV